MICALRSLSAPGPRRALLGAMGVLYLLPSLLGTLLQIAHGLEHALTTPVSSGTEATAGVVVHSHDGSTHAHGAVVAVLAAAAVDEDDDPEADPEAVPPLVLLALRSTGPELTVPSAGSASSVPEDSGLAAREGTTPPLPPPRG